MKEKNKCNVYFQKEDNSSLDKIISKLDTSGKCPSVNSDGTVNVTAGESENSLVCSAPDDYGTSYYFRGNVTDNYVKYSDRYWRIIRINGDGTIRMIYDGTEAHANGEVSDDRRYTESYFDIIYDVREANYMYGSQVGIVKSNIFCSSCYGEKMSISRSFSMQKNKYNLYELVLDNPVSVSCADMENNLDKYLGYYFEFGNGGLGHVISTEKSCYGEELFIGPISKEDAQQNVLSSHFKIDTDSLFTNNIIAPSFRGIIKDEIYCNDRNTNSSNYVQDSVYFRWADTPWSSSSKQYPRLKCSQINDAFTVNDTNKGNGALTYPVGNLTADEAVLAGAWSNENTKYFLYDGKGFATMSPHQVFSPIISAIGSIMKIESNGSLASADDVYPFGIRPVINVSSVILNNGSGTSTDPYRLEN